MVGMNIKIRIITTDGKLSEIINPIDFVAVGDRVTITYYNGSWTQTSTWFIATMEILPLESKS